MRLEAAIWWKMGIKAGKIDILAQRFIRLRDDMSRKSVYYIGSAEGHEYPNLQVGDEVDPRLSFCVNSKSINSCFF